MQVLENTLGQDQCLGKARGLLRGKLLRGSIISGRKLEALIVPPKLVVPSESHLGTVRRVLARLWVPSSLGACFPMRHFTLGLSVLSVGWKEAHFPRPGAGSWDAVQEGL